MEIFHKVKLKIGHKLLIITIISLAGMILTLFLFYQGLSSSLMQEKIFQTHRLSDSGLSIIKHYYELAENKKLSKIVAQKNALNTLKSSRFGPNGYFWINDVDTVLLMHPYADSLINKNLTSLEDKTGNHMFVKFVETAVSGGGLVDYYWQKPNTSEVFPKTSYVVYFEPWGWVLGTGLYLDDMEQDIQGYAISALGVVFIVSVLLVAFSIMSTKKIMLELENMAIRDPLTSLHTRRFMNDHMERLLLCHEREKDKYLAIVFFDIDYFKNVNDNYGHSCGDEVISKVSGVIKHTSRPDDLCIRYGGEEFVVILLSDNKDTAEKYAERVRAKVNKLSFSCQNIDFSISISAGIASRKSDEDFYETLKRADENLYKAKDKGRNCVVCL